MGLVDPQDYSGAGAAALFVGLVLAVAILGGMVFVVASMLRMLFTGGFRRLRHEWFSSAGDCSYSDCWRPVRYKVTTPRLSERQQRDHYMYLCESCTFAHYEDLPRERLADADVKRWEQAQRRAARQARVDRLERLR